MRSAICITFLRDIQMPFSAQRDAEQTIMRTARKRSSAGHSSFPDSCWRGHCHHTQAVLRPAGEGQMNREFSDAQAILFPFVWLRTQCTVALRLSNEASSREIVFCPQLLSLLVAVSIITPLPIYGYGSHTLASKGTRRHYDLAKNGARNI